MVFTETEIAEHTATLEEQFWSRRRPPLHLRDKIREGQRFDGTSIELFFGWRACYARFLETSHSPGDADQIREVFIHGHYLSQKDIEICAAFAIADEFDTHPNFPSNIGGFVYD